ncbi:MAG: DUF4292 domain-containing protein [Deltaproteobacteria bacterium]|nr:DUF4292 domain-containing protein [Deltaproteobacteria bacterium]MBW2085522.1 DUF4292 domain-containing protein [Deltaproteobacteria bacterium]
MKRRSGTLKASCLKLAGSRQILLALLAFSFAGCASLAPVIPEPPLPEASALVDHFRAQQGRIKSFVARGRLRVESPQVNYQAKITLAAVRPARFRLTAIDFFGRSMMTLASNQGEIFFLDHSRARLYRGPISQGTLKRFLPFNLKISDIITFFVGGVILSSHQEAEVSRVEPGLWRLSLLGPNKATKERIYLDPLNRRVLRIEMSFKAEDGLMQIEFSDYRDLEGQEIPFHIRLTDRQEKAELILDYQELKLDFELPDRLFNLSAPPGVEVIDLPG